MRLQPVNPKRNYGIDALRILSMLMIIFHHVITHGGLLKSREFLSFGYDLLTFLDIAVLCAVNCYVLISGYVGVCSRHKYSSLASLWLQVVFYSAGITLLFLLFKPEAVTFTRVWKSFLPALTREYWFFTNYFILFLLMPMLNAAVNALSRRRLEIMLVTLIVFIGVFGSIYDGFYNTDVYGVNRGYSVWWMMVLYMVGAYVRKYDAFSAAKPSRLLILYGAAAVISTALRLLVLGLTNAAVGKPQYTNLFTKYTSLNICVCAMALFLLFRNLRFKDGLNRWIAFLSPMTFSVYLIHDHPYVREYFIKVHLKFIHPMSTPLVVLMLIVAAVAIYLVCSAIDLLRIRLFGWLKVKERLERLEQRIINKIGA